MTMPDKINDVNIKFPRKILAIKLRLPKLHSQYFSSDMTFRINILMLAK